MKKSTIKKPTSPKLYPPTTRPALQTRAERIQQIWALAKKRAGLGIDVLA